MNGGFNHEEEEEQKEEENGAWMCIRIEDLPSDGKSSNLL